MSNQHPRKIECHLESLAATVDLQKVVFVAPVDCTVTAVDYYPVADITGANTDYRRLQLFNRGADGAGTDVIASLSFTSGVNAEDFEAEAFTLSATAADLEVAAGDVVTILSDSPGTGMVDPGGLLVVTIG